MASTRTTGFEVMTTGATGADPAGWMSNGCVLVMFTAGAVVGVGRGRTLIRAVSFFGPRFTDGALLLSSRMGTGRTAAPGSLLGSEPGGFGNGCKSGEVEAGGVTGGRLGKMRGASIVAGSVSGVEGSALILGGKRRIGVTGVREGKTIRAVSLATLGAEPACSGRGGSAMRTVSFFGSAMTISERFQNRTNLAGLSLVNLFFW
jgi:hypothetical protein